MTETTTITIRIPLHTKEQLDALARVTGRSPSALTQQALTDYLEAESWQIDDISRALDEAAQEAFASDFEVAAFFAHWSHED